MTAIENLLSPEVVRMIGWTLVHSIWQGVVVALLLAVTFALLRRRSANARYVAACAALLLMAGAALLTAGLLSFRLGTGMAASDPVSASAGVAALPVVRSPAAASPAPDGQAPRPISLGQPPPMGSPPLAARAPWHVQLSTFLEALLPWIVLGWLAGVIVLSMRLLGGWAQAERLKRRGTRFVAEVWRERLRRLADRLRVTRPVQLLESTLAEVPTAIGWLRPVILIPTGALTGLTPGQLEALLAHELAHVRRYDYLVNVLQTVIETLLFYHPAVWWISRRIRTEREHCCDDLAVAACGDALGYARALADLEERRGIPAHVAVAASDASLLGRVRRLTGVAAPRKNRSAGWLGAAIVIAFAAAAGSGLWFAHATQPAPTKQDGEDEGPQTASVYKPIPAESGPTNTVTGIVIDEDDQPVGDAPVLAVFGHPQSDAEPGPQRTTRSGADGRFVFEDLKPDGLWCFSVNDPRFARQWEYGTYLRLPTETLDLPLRIRVHKPRTLNGIVVDESGAAAAGVRVTLAREWLPGSDEPVQGWLAWDLQVTETDGEGRFRFERVRPGRVTLVLDHHEYAQTLTDPVDVRDAETRVTIKKGLTLRGRVTHDGKPLEAVRVTVNAINLAHRPLGRWQATTDAAGEFSVERVAGFSADVLRHGSATVAAVFVDDAAWHSHIYHVGQVDEHTLPFVEIAATPGAQDPDERAVTRVGQVDPAAQAKMGGPPVGDGVLEVEFVGDPEGYPGQPREIRVVRIGVDESGLYVRRVGDLGEGTTVVFEKLPAGTYYIWTNNWWTPNYPAQVVDLADKQRARVRMEPGPGRLSGVIRSGGEVVKVSDTQRAGVGFITMRLRQPNWREQYKGTVQADGTYEVAGIPFGWHMLTVNLPGSWPHHMEVEVREADTRVDVDLPQGRISGTVLGDLPAPEPHGLEPHVMVLARDENARFEGPGLGLMLDEDQSFALNHVPPGVYTLSVFTDGDTHYLPVTVRLKRDDDVVDSELRQAKRTGWIAGSITAASPAAQTALAKVSNVVIYVAPKDELGYDFNSDLGTNVEPGKQKYRIKEAPVGTYGLLVTSHPKGVPLVWRPNVEVREGLICNLDIGIPEGRDIALQVVYESEHPAPAVWSLGMPTGDWIPFGHIVGSPGVGVITRPLRFTLSHGEYVVEADFGGATRVTQAFTVEPGEGVQEIVVPMP